MSRTNQIDLNLTAETGRDALELLFSEIRTGRDALELLRNPVILRCKGPWTFGALAIESEETD